MSVKTAFYPAIARALTLSVSLLAVMSAGPMAHGETLAEALASAYETHPQLKAERARVREVDENYVQARAQGRFTSSAQGSIGLNQTRVRTPSFDPTRPSTIVSVSESFAPRSFQITGQKPLYQGGRVRSLMGQAKYGVLSAREGLRQAEQTVLLSAATAYADMVQNQEALLIRRNNVRVLERQVEAANTRFDVGAGTRTDIAQADARLAGAQIGLSQAQAALEQSRADYIRAIGHIPQQLEPVPEYALPATLAQAQNMAVTYNPQLEAARYAQDAAKYGIDVAKSAGKPVISLQTFAQVAQDQGTIIIGQETIGISANITVPITTGGLSASQVRAAREAENRAIFEMRNVEYAIKAQVATLWAQLQAAKQSLSASQAQVRAAQIAFEGVEIEQQVGTRNALDVLNAEQEVLNAKLGVAQARRSVDVLSFQLLSLLGAFDAPSLNLGVELYDPQSNFEAVTRSNLLSWPGGAQPIEDLKHIPVHLKKIPEAIGSGLQRVSGEDESLDIEELEP